MSRLGNNLTRFRRGKTLSTEINTYGFIQSSVLVDDGTGGIGGDDDDWINTSENPHAFALIPTSSSQVWEDKTVNVKASHIIKMRAEIEISQLDRITVDPGGGKPLRIFEILDIDNIQNRDIVNWVVCKERLD